MDRSNVGDSSTGQSDQSAILGNTRELETFLVEMKIASGDLSMEEAMASQGRDAQQRLGDVVDALNEDLVTMDPMDGKGSQEDPTILDEYPMDPNEDAAAKPEDAKKQLGDAAGQVGDPEEALVRGEGIA